ncbi:MAG: UvrD-helicase domain-containing protein [Bacteroidota bacterium]
MVEARLKLEPEVQEIFSLMDAKENFLLSGGAGSGKTYSLVQVIRQAIAEHPSAKIACMTYTNAAVKEIEERVNHKNLNVTTIHDFLWDNIKHFQKELKAALVNLCNDEAATQFTIDEPSPLPKDYFGLCEDGIQYKEFVKLKEGIISHDEVLIVASHIFQSYPKLSDIIKDKYSFIFIDEYQDTSRSVVDIFLTHFGLSGKQNIIGFFGDAMQSIYDDTIGNLNDYIDKVKEIKKEQNRRNPKRIIDLANRLRTDGIVQVSSTDKKAPNMQNGVLREGNVLFLYSNNEDISRVKDFLSDQYGWHFIDAKETKELNLTHNLIADRAGFRTLMDIYDKDPVIGLKADILKKIKDNKKNNVPEIAILDEDTFDMVVDKYQLKNRQKQLKKDVLLQNTENAKFYNQLKDQLFSEVRKIYLDKDALIDDKKKDEKDESKKGSKRDNLIKHLFKIQTNIFLYQSRLYNEFLRVTDYRYRILSIADKKALKENIESLIDVGDKTIEQIIADADAKGLCIIDDKLNNFIEKNTYLYNRVKDVRFSEFQFLYNYLEGKTPFSTQHKTKGTEFDNVLVILDNGGWNDYNFNYLFDKDNIYAELVAGKSKTKSKLEAFPRILERTQKIFYVCCTRAKENLAVFYHDPSVAVIAKAKEWFGADSVMELK